MLYRLVAYQENGSSNFVLGSLLPEYFPSSVRLRNFVVADRQWQPLTLFLRWPISNRKLGEERRRYVSSAVAEHGGRGPILLRDLVAWG